MSRARQLTYLVADLRLGLQGLAGAFFILLFDPMVRRPQRIYCQWLSPA
jgi:hypothetical protein